MSSDSPWKKEVKKESWHRNCLANFPTEVLNLMTGYLNGFSILALYNCGSGLLNYKLRKNGAVTHFRVRCNKDVYPPYRDWRNHNFHSLALFQSLETLEFVGFSSYAFRYFTAPIVSRLCRTLKIIRFDFIEAMTMWVDSIKSPEGTEFFEAFALGECFPQLRELELRSGYWDRLTLYKGKVCVAYTWTAPTRVQFLSRLPQSLTKLTFNCVGCPEDFPTAIPPNVDQLCIILTHDAPRHWIQHLNPEIRTLEVTGYNLSLPYEEMKILPRGLTSLKIEALAAPEEEPYELPNFPETLTFLQIGYNCQWMDSTFMNSLPMALTTMQFAGVSDKLKDDVVQHFPRTLTHLCLAEEIAVQTQITHLALMDLPSQLKNLNLASAIAWPWSALEMLPQTLEKLWHSKFEPAEHPEDPDAAQAETLLYWKGKAPRKCIISATHWYPVNEPPP